MREGRAIGEMAPNGNGKWNLINNRWVLGTLAVLGIVTLYYCGIPNFRGNPEPSKKVEQVTKTRARPSNSAIPLEQIFGQNYQLTPLAEGDNVVYSHNNREVTAHSLDWYAVNDREIILGQNPRFNGDKYFLIALQRGVDGKLYLSNANEPLERLKVKTVIGFSIDQKGLEDNILNPEDIKTDEIKTITGPDNRQYLLLQATEGSRYPFTVMPKEETTTILDRKTNTLQLEGIPYVADDQARISQPNSSTYQSGRQAIAEPLPR